MRNVIALLSDVLCDFCSLEIVGTGVGGAFGRMELDYCGVTPEKLTVTNQQKSV